MRLLHTSDWHLGRTFHGRSLLADQQQVLLALAAAVERERIDVVLIAGDLYDRAVPSIDAVQLATRSLRRIREAGAQIVLTTGNHDSAPRVGAFTDFLAAGGLHVCADVDRLGTPVLLGDEYGPVAIYGIPYLDPDVARHQLAPQAGGHAGVLAAAMDRVRADLADRAGTRSVVLAHAFVIGGAATDSERCLDAGGTATPTSTPTADDPLVAFKRGTVGSVPAAVFSGVDYVALGHLHRRQSPAPWLRYSGSLLPYSFSEAGQRKGCWVVELTAAGLGEVRPVELPVIRELATLRGELADLLAGYEEFREHYLAFELTDLDRPTDPMRRLLGRYPHAMKLEWRPPGLESGGPRYPATHTPVDDAALIAEFLTDLRGNGPSRSESALIARALSTAARAEAAA